jgi:SH3-like domain-containing protein
MALVAAGFAAICATAVAAPDPNRPAPFASLKVDRVEVFRTPVRDGAPVWVFLRAGLPVEVLRREGGWSEIRDQEGAVGWAANHHLSNRRTALVRPGTDSRLILRADPRDSASATAEVEPGVLAGVETCDGRWCLLAIGRVKGWLEQNRLWGVALGEQFD